MNETLVVSDLKFAFATSGYIKGEGHLNVNNLSVNFWELILTSSFLNIPTDPLLHYNGFCCLYCSIDGGDIIIAVS